MSKVHLKTINKKPKRHDIGFVEEWKLSGVKDLVPTYNVSIGKENIFRSKNDRVLYVIQGSATNLETKEIFEEGSMIEIPAGKSFTFQGQLKYFCVEAV